MKFSLALVFATSLGIAVSALGIAAGAQTLSQVFAFSCPGILQPCADGAEPGSIIQASDGSLYGLSSSTEGYHSTKIGSWYNGGGLWKINPSNGQLTLLFTFTEANTGFWPDGTQPKDQASYCTSLGILNASCGY